MEDKVICKIDMHACNHDAITVHISNSRPFIGRWKHLLYEKMIKASSAQTRPESDAAWESLLDLFHYLQLGHRLLNPDDGLEVLAFHLLSRQMVHLQ